jgi:excisionase family DNA binding protein
MPDDLPDDLMPLKDAAKLIKVNRPTLLRWILRGKVDGYRIGYRWFVRRADVLATVQRWTAEDARRRRAEVKAELPLTKKGGAKNEEWVEAELKRLGVR